MSNSKKSRKAAGARKSAPAQSLGAAAPGQAEPVEKMEPVVTRAVREQPVPVVQSSAQTQKGGVLGLSTIELCVLAMSGTTLLAVIMLAWSISGQLQQMAGAEQMDKLAAQVSRITDSLEESLKQNKAALDSSISASRLDQRAWVGVKSIQMSPMEAGKPLKMEIKISNSGKTFALDLRHTGILHLSEKPLSNVAPADKEALAGQPRQVPTLVTLAPNGESLIPCASLAPLTDEMIAAISAGKVHVYLLGEISYTDVFKQWHTTRFFQRYVPAEQKFMAEQAHNDVD